MDELIELTNDLNALLTKTERLYKYLANIHQQIRTQREKHVTSMAKFGDESLVSDTIETFSTVGEGIISMQDTLLEIEESIGMMIDYVKSDYLVDDQNQNEK